jgi:hypothetical protein
LSKVIVSIATGVLVVSIALFVMHRLPEDDVQSREYWERKFDDHATKAQESMRIEAIDPEWARGAEVEFSSFLDQQAVLRKLGIPQIECHSVTCRLQLVASDAEAISTEEWFSYLRTGIRDFEWHNSWSIIGFTAYRANEGTTVAWYFRTSSRPLRGSDMQFAFELLE